MKKFSITRVCEDDLPLIAKLEQKIWGTMSGAHAIDIETLHAWWLQQSPFFLIAFGDDGSVGGYMYSVQITSGKNYEYLLSICQDKILQETGVINLNHDSNGDCLFNVSVTIAHPTAGKMLKEETIRLINELGIEKVSGISRLSNFGTFLSNSNMLSISTILPKEVIADWYVRENLRIVKHSSDKPVETPSNIDFPTLKHADVAIRYNTSGLPFELVQVLPLVPGDVESAGMGALLVAHMPHRLK